jgi:MFS family permease
LSAKTGGLSRNLWLYLTAGAFWSFGLMSFFLVYNLYLLSLGRQEDFMGRVSGAMTLGSLVFTFPASWLLNRFGSNLIIQTGVACTAATLLLRALCENPELLVVLAFLNGLSIAAWMVTTPVFLTQNTLSVFRSRAFSLSYGTSIGMGAIAGVAVGAASRFLSYPGKLTGVFRLLSTERIILVGCCLCVLASFLLLLFLRENLRFPVTRLLATLSPDGIEGKEEILSPRPLGEGEGVNPFRGLQSRRFILRLLLVLTLWSLFVGSFSPFFNVFFYRRFHQSLQGIGVIFSLSQFCQVLAVLSMPWLMARLGRVRAIFCMQTLAACVLPLLLLTSSVEAAGMIYLTYLSFQVMSEPALENFIMDSVPPKERSLISSLRYMILFLMQALSVWASGFAIISFGYSHLLVALAAIGISASAAFYFSFRSTTPNIQGPRIT